MVLGERWLWRQVLSIQFHRINTEKVLDCYNMLREISKSGYSQTQNKWGDSTCLALHLYYPFLPLWAGRDSYSEPWPHLNLLSIVIAYQACQIIDFGLTRTSFRKGIVLLRIIISPISFGMQTLGMMQLICPASKWAYYSPPNRM